MVDTGETEEQQDVVKKPKVRTTCTDCAGSERQKALDDAHIQELTTRLALTGKQVTHLADQVRLLERHLEQKELEAEMNEKRENGDAGYSIAAHVDLLTAIMGEYQLLRTQTQITEAPAPT